MNNRTAHWLRGLGSAFISGGSSAVTSGVTSMGFAPDKFNLQNLSGLGHLLALMGANFLVSALLSVMFYLRQSPLPDEPTGNTQVITKPPTNP